MIMFHLGKNATGIHMHMTWRQATLFTSAVALLVCHTSAFAAETAFRCTNSASGKIWTLKVDDARRTVDNFPAVFGKAQISWRDTAEGGNYQLDLSSGLLTYTNASSTGGYMLFHQCRPK